MRMLVVEDHPEVLGILCEILRFEGFAVDSTNNAPDARAAIGRTHYDVVVLDMLLGDDLGSDILSELADRPDAPRIVALSGAPNEIHWARRYRVPFVSKPFGIDVLLDAVRQAKKPERTRVSGSSQHRLPYLSLPRGTD